MRKGVASAANAKTPTGNIIMPNPSSRKDNINPRQQQKWPASLPAGQAASLSAS